MIILSKKSSTYSTYPLPHLPLNLMIFIKANLIIQSIWSGFAKRKGVKGGLQPQGFLQPAMTIIADAGSITLRRLRSYQWGHMVKHDHQNSLIVCVMTMISNRRWIQRHPKP